jgi:hypothetical protein
MRSMLESTKELEEKKRTLEKTQDLLNEELVKLRAQGKLTLILKLNEKFSFRPSSWFIV